MIRTWAGMLSLTILAGCQLTSVGGPAPAVNNSPVERSTKRPATATPQSTRKPVASTTAQPGVARVPATPVAPLAPTTGTATPLSTTGPAATTGRWLSALAPETTPVEVAPPVATGDTQLVNHETPGAVAEATGNPTESSYNAMNDVTRELLQRVRYQSQAKTSGEPNGVPGDGELAAPLNLRPLELQEVTQSIQASFPALQIALQEMGIADAKILAAWGEFDLKIKAESFSAPEGYYKTFRNLVKLEQALYQGGSVYGHYRIGDGNFQPWYGERETNEGGEFKFGVMTPILRDRLIDQRRAEILKAELVRDAVDPAVQAQILDFVLAGSETYWNWVAAGQSLQVQTELLRLTQERNRVYQARVDAQDLPRIELVQNERLIASREAKLIESQRKLQQSAIKLSLFLRNETGEMLLPAQELLPRQFPDPAPVDTLPLDVAIQTAYQNRPELLELQRQVQIVTVDYDWGNNQLLPALNVGLEAGKDVGAAASSKGDKTPFELEAGLMFDMPLQRRKAKGKIIEAENKLAQLRSKRQFAENKIANETRDAISALSTAYDRAQKARRNVELSNELVEAERERFAAQDSDLLRVAIQESAAIEAALQEIEALADYHKAAAAYRAATASSLSDVTQP